MNPVEKPEEKIDFDEKHWHALYVRSRSERKVLAQLNEKGIEAYLPLITRIKQWSDRKKKIEEPLFKSYVFVHNSLRQHYDVLNVYGVVRFVTFEHKAVVVPDNQIIAIKKYIDDPVEDEKVLNDNNDLKVGQLVRITNGVLQGLMGRLVSVNNKRRLVVYIESVGKVIPVSISRAKVEPIEESPKEGSIEYR